MLTIKNTRIEGFESAIRGMRNPMNSWSKSDSMFFDLDGYYDISGEFVPGFEKFVDSAIIGPNDRKLMESLRDAGTDHSKYKRMIVVWTDILAPLYWWKEFDTYKVGTVANSCSTMHKIQEKEFTLDDFSCEHLDDKETCYTEDVGDPHLNPTYTSLDILKIKVEALNYWRARYNATKDKHAWWQMIQLLDTTFNQKRTVMLNYEVLSNIYRARRNHKLDEWHTFCDWILTLPANWIIVGKKDEKDA